MIALFLLVEASISWCIEDLSHTQLSKFLNISYEILTAVAGLY